MRQNVITTGTVGAKGGIELAVPFSEITLGKIVEVIDSGVEFSICCGDKTNECPNMYECAMRNVWNTISDKIQRELNAISLEKIMEQYVKSFLGFMRKAKCFEKMFPEKIHDTIFAYIFKCYRKY